MSPAIYTITYTSSAGEGSRTPVLEDFHRTHSTIIPQCYLYIPSQVQLGVTVVALNLQLGLSGDNLLTVLAPTGLSRLAVAVFVPIPVKMVDGEYLSVFCPTSNA